jgi:hypothetical protein
MGKLHAAITALMPQMNIYGCIILPIAIRAFQDFAQATSRVSAIGCEARVAFRRSAYARHRRFQKFCEFFAT